MTFYQVIDGKSYEKETVAQIVGAGTDHATTSTVSINETGDYYAVIEVVDGAKVIADPAEAAKTKVEATIVEQFKGDKQLVFKFKKRKNYKKLRGHRQQLTRVKIESVGSATA